MSAQSQQVETATPGSTTPASTTPASTVPGSTVPGSTVPAAERVADLLADLDQVSALPPATRVERLEAKHAALREILAESSAPDAEDAPPAPGPQSPRSHRRDG